MSKILIAYFSTGDTTAVLAKNLAEAIGGDLFEIVPQEPYSMADLNDSDRNSRSAVEMRDRTSRPAIASSVENMDQYEVVFIGFPIWWEREPSIIDTFLESYNFSGKTIIPFVTSVTSEIGKSARNIQEFAIGANVMPGKRLAADMSPSELEKWAKGWI